jgi:hypothetical protein
MSAAGRREMTPTERGAYSGLAALAVGVAVFALLTPGANSLLLGPSYKNSIVPNAEYKRQVYFNKPETLYYDEPAEIVLALESKALGPGQLTLSFQNLDGKVEERSVKVGAYLSARLSADPSQLAVVPSDDKLRKIAAEGETKFAWFVRPVDIGAIPVRLDLFSQDSPSKDSAVRSVQVFQENWTATATGFNRAKYVLSEYKWGFTAIGGVLTFFGVNTWLKRRDEDADDED